MEGGMTMKVVWRTLLLCLVAAVNIFSTLLPIWPGRFFIIAHGLPLWLILAAQDATLFLGVTMLLLAYPVALGHRRAAQLLLGCAGLAILTNIAKGLDVEEALVNIALFTVLWRQRARFSRMPLRYTAVDVARVAIGIVLIVRVYTLLGRALMFGLFTLVERGVTSVPGYHHSLWQHVRFLLTAKLTLESLWFHQSQYLLPLFLVVVFVAFSWTSLLHPEKSAVEVDDPYGRFGRASHNSLAYLARRSDVSTFVAPDGSGAVSYKLVGRVALQIGAVLAPVEARERVYRAYCAFCQLNGLVPAAVALSQEEQPVASLVGMHSLPIGTEAVVDLAGFSVEGLNKKMRWVQRSLSKRGYRAELVRAPEITPVQRSAMARIEADWREQRGGQMHGCCMTLGRVPTPDDPDCLIGFMYAPDNSLVAFLTLLPGGEGYYSLDLTRRLREAPNATMEFLLMEVLAALRERGASVVSLNFSTFSSLAASRIGAFLLNLCGVAFQLRSLETFNNKFKPAWVPRYAVFPSWFTFPDVAYAILKVEGVDAMLLNATTRAVRRVLLREGEPGAVEQAAQAEV